VGSGYPNVLTERAIVAGTFGYRSSASLGDMNYLLRVLSQKQNYSQ